MSWGFPEAAVLTCIAFHRFLRTSEFINLRVSQVIFDRLVTQAHLQFPESKGAARRGVVESVHITDAQLVKLLRKCMAGKQMGDNILPQTPAQYRELFALACHALSLDTEFKPYSLRRGGATEHFRDFGRMDWTMEIGRWAEARTARVYINSALLQFVQMERLKSPLIQQAADAFKSLVDICLR